MLIERRPTIAINSFEVPQEARGDSSLGEKDKSQCAINPFSFSSFKKLVFDTFPMLESEWRRTGQPTDRLIATRITSVKLAIGIIQRRCSLSDEEQNIFSIAVENFIHIEDKFRKLRELSSKNTETICSPPGLNDKLELNTQEYEIVEGLFSIFKPKNL